MDVNVLGLSTLRKKEEKTRENNTDGSKKLQAYLAEQYGSATVKKKKKKKKKIVASQGLAIVDADIDTSRVPQEPLPGGVEDDGTHCIQTRECRQGVSGICTDVLRYVCAEDAPVVVNAGEFQRIQLQEQRQNELLGKNGTSSPGQVYRAAHEQMIHGDSDGDVSPPRRQRHDSDVDSDGDMSPPRRQRHDSDVDSDGDVSPPRRPQGTTQVDDKSLVGARMSDGTLTGMISGKDLKKEMEDARRREREKFNQLDDTVTGKNAGTVYRSEDGRAMSKDEYLDKLKHKKEQEKKFIQGSEIPWGKGLRQTKDIHEITPSAPVPSRWDDPMAHVPVSYTHLRAHET